MAVAEFPSSAHTEDDNEPAPALDVRWLHQGANHLSLLGASSTSLTKTFEPFTPQESTDLEAVFLNELTDEERALTATKNPDTALAIKTDKDKNGRMASERSGSEEVVDHEDEEAEKAAVDADELLQREEEERARKWIETKQADKNTAADLARMESMRGVSVAKDGLFEVNVREMKLYPVFWVHRGPNIPVFRGRWFFNDRAPCPEALSDELEEGYMATQPWRKSYGKKLREALKQPEKERSWIWHEFSGQRDLDNVGACALYQTDDVAEVVKNKASVSSRVSQTLFSTLRATGTFSGGQLVYRGYTAARQVAHLQASSVDEDEVLEGVDKPVLKDNGEPGEPPASAVTDLCLVVHGIGQKLAQKHESYNSVFDANNLRQEVQRQVERPEIAAVMGEGQIQFLPIQWRANFKLKDNTQQEEDENNSYGLHNQYDLEDVTLKKSIPWARELMNSVLIDVPYFMSNHREAMIEAVACEANRIYRLWCSRHPDFAHKGRVHIIGHSLGSAIVAHILSQQPTLMPSLADLPDKVVYETRDRFIFNTHCLFLIGSPLGLFMHLENAQMIARRGRARTQFSPAITALDRAGRFGCFAVDSVYNIFEPSDPIAYALNATVDRELAQTKEPLEIESVTSTLLESISGSVTELFKGMPSFFGNTNIPVTEAQQPKDAETASVETVIGSIADRRFAALNPHSAIDFFLPSTGAVSEYLDMLAAHSAYWTDRALAAFLVTEVFSAARRNSKMMTA